MSNEKPIRIYADGVYDMFHFGHAQQLEQAKKLRPNVTLVVGVTSDEDTISPKEPSLCTKRKEPYVCSIVNGSMRLFALVHGRLPKFMDKHKIDYVAHDEAPYVSAGSDDVYAFVKKQGKFLATQRTEGVSTSDLITRILKDRDVYIQRNLSRGATRSELNVSWLKQTWLNIRTKFCPGRNKTKLE